VLGVASVPEVAAPDCCSLGVVALLGVSWLLAPVVSVDGVVVLDGVAVLDAPVLSVAPVVPEVEGGTVAGCAYDGVFSVPEGVVWV